MREGTSLDGRYVLKAEIGHGGQGVVWRAWDPRLGREVAVKQVLLGRLSPTESENARARLMREAQIAARVVHGNVVSVFDSVEHEGEPWMVLEYVNSQNLAEVIETRGVLPPLEVARIGARVADGLAAAHAVGVEHRDVKPGNVLITESGLVKLTDFGIARAVGDVSLTRTGVLSATLPYLAVEVARGKGWSSAADVWALGATLYAALDGSPPFGTDGDELRLLHRLMSGEFPPSRNAGPLAGALDRLLATDPSVRPDAATAARLLDDVATGRAAEVRAGGGPGQQVRARDETRVPTGPGPAPGPGHPGPGATFPPPGPGTSPGPSRSGRKKVVAAVLAVVVVGGGAAAAVTLNRSGDQAPATGPAAVAPPGTVGPIRLTGNQREADPCALLDAGALRQFGPTAELGGDSFPFCQLQITTAASSVASTVSVGFDQPVAAIPAGASETKGDITVVRPEPTGTSCSRTVVLTDRTPVIVGAFNRAGSPDLCTIADAATTSAVATLARSGIVYVPGRLSEYLLSSADACALVDRAVLGSVTGIDGTREVPGFGRWSCRLGPSIPGRAQASTFFQVTGEPSGTSLGDRTTIAGREAYVAGGSGTYNASACDANVVTRRYTSGGAVGAEIFTVRVDAPGTPEAVCRQAAALASAAGPKLPSA